MRHSELNYSRQMGCEMEMTMPLVGTGNGRDVQETLANVLSANGLRAIARGYSNDLLPPNIDIGVEHDASVGGENRYRGITWHSIEVKTRILQGVTDWEAIVPRMLDICRYMGARVNSSCGHHLHVAIPEVHHKLSTIRSLFNLIHRFEPILYGIVAPSRRHNGYAMPLPDQSRMLHGCRALRTYRGRLAQWNRRHGLNLCHVLDSEPRVELRHHHATLDAEKARHWMRLLNRIVEHAVTRNCAAASRQVENTRKGLEAFRYTVGLKSNPKIYAKISSELKETNRWLLRRWKHFNAPENSSDHPSAE